MEPELPQGWAVVRRRGRPKYRRRDGFVLTVCLPGVWGLYEPGQDGAPMLTFEEQHYAMEWTNAQYPERAHG